MNRLLKAKRYTQALFLPRGDWNKKRTEWIMKHCYVDMYKAAGGDFNELVKNATLNERGEKEIPFNDYEIDKGEFYAILAFYQSLFKEKYYKQALSNSIHLGCSPRFANGNNTV